MSEATAPFPSTAAAPAARRYRALDRPLFVHCCHCRWCQRESGASFVLALIEAIRAVRGVDEASVGQVHHLHRGLARDRSGAARAGRHFCAAWRAITSRW